MRRGIQKQIKIELTSTERDTKEAEKQQRPQKSRYRHNLRGITENVESINEKAIGMTILGQKLTSIPQNKK